MKGLFYFLFVLVSLGLCFLVTNMLPSNSVSESAANADLLISSSRLYAREHAYNRSLLHLDMAIKTIIEIEQNLDPENRTTIDKAIEELQRVYTEIKENNLVDEDMSRAFTLAENALTFAEIKVTEHFLETDEFHSAMAALKSGKIHMQNALKFADQGHMAYELNIYQEIDSILNHSELSKEEIVVELEKMLVELNDLAE